MKFIITRTSISRTSDTPPCDGCTLKYNTYPGGEFPEFSKEFTTFEDVISFMKEHEEVVMTYNDMNDTMTAEIYDDYRE